MLFRSYCNCTNFGWTTHFPILNAKSENCILTRNGSNVCEIETTFKLGLVSQSQEICILMKNDQEQTMGTISIAVK